jgi:signal peptidase I
MTEQQPQGPVVMRPLSQGSAPQPQPPQSDGYKRHTRSGIGSFASTIAVLLIAPLVALILTSFIFQSYQVDGPSMETTLYNNDRLLVWKLPKTWSRITGHTYIPKRGDVVIFVERGFGEINGKQLIKRVIGLPGDRVVVSDNEVTIYNKEHPDGFKPDQTLTYGKNIPETSGNVDTVIADGQIYVMGDNRPGSMDSRTFGAVNAKDIVGKLIMRVWPINQAKNF